MKSRFLQNLNEMPGPVWLFGAFGISRLFEWLLAMSTQLASGSLWWSWTSAGMQVLGLVSGLLPVGLFCCLVLRNPYGMPSVRWYAGLRVLLHGISLFSPLLTGYNPELMGGYAPLVRMLVLNMTWGALWFVFLFYLERSETLAMLMPPENRKGLWWFVLLMAAIVVLCM